VSDGEDENLRVELDVNDRKRKSVDQPTTDVELTRDAAHERPFLGGVADRRLSRHDMFVESTGSDHTSARIPAHGVEKLGSRL
jgi:hypothetical protein